MLSPDQEFQEKGGTTEIDYQHAFINYKKLLSEGTPQMNGIISYYTQEVFNHQPKKPLRPTSSATSAVDSEFAQFRRNLYGNATDPVTKEVPPPHLPRKSSAQPEDHSAPAPASPIQSEHHVSVSITSSVSQTVTASSRVSTTTNNPTTPEHDAEESPPPPKTKASRPAPKTKASRPAPRKKKAATADASSGDLGDAPPAEEKRNSNKRGKVVTPPDRSLRQRK